MARKVVWSVFGGYINHQPPAIPNEVIVWTRTVTHVPIRDRERRVSESMTIRESLTRQISRDQSKLDYLDMDIRDTEDALSSLRAQRDNLVKSIEEQQRALQAIEDADRVVALEAEVAILKKQLATRNQSQNR